MYTTYKQALRSVRHCWMNLKFVSEKMQTDEICSYALRQSVFSLQFIKNPTYELCLNCVKQNWRTLAYIKREFQTHELCILALERSNYAYQFIKNPTHEFNLSVIENRPGILRYIQQPEYELCLKAIKRYGWMIGCIKPNMQSLELCIIALEQNPLYIQYIGNRTPDLMSYCKLMNIPIRDYIKY